LRLPAWQTTAKKTSCEEFRNDMRSSEWMQMHN
jgi:hypothetical protein